MKIGKILLAGAIALSPALALAAPPATPPAHGPGGSDLNRPDSAGQPNASCEEAGTRPGNAESAPGSAFNPDGIAGTKYAGEQPQNSRNPMSVSQYDVACVNQPG